MAGERDVLAEAREILDRHIIRVARYYWPKGSHIETFAREALAALAAAPSPEPLPLDPDPTIGMRIVRCPHCGEELSVWPVAPSLEHHRP